MRFEPLACQDTPQILGVKYESAKRSAFLLFRTIFMILGPSMYLCFLCSSGADGPALNATSYIVVVVADQATDQMVGLWRMARSCFMITRLGICHRLSHVAEHADPDSRT